MSIGMAQFIVLAKFEEPVEAGQLLRADLAFRGVTSAAAHVAFSLLSPHQMIDEKFLEKFLSTAVPRESVHRIPGAHVQWDHFRGSDRFWISKSLLKSYHGLFFSRK